MLGVGLLERNQIMKCLSWYNMLKFSAMGTSHTALLPCVRVSRCARVASESV
jgi:hypothetical protein